MGRLRERVPELRPCGSLKYFYEVFLPGSLEETNHFGLPCSQSIFGISQDPPKCAQASLSQNGFYRKGIWVGNIP